MKKDISLAGLFGNEPTSKVLEHLLITRGVGCSITDISRATLVTRPTIYKIIRRMLKQKIIFVFETKNQSRLFKLDKNVPTVKVLIQAHKKLLMLSD